MAFLKNNVILYVFLAVCLLFIPESLGFCADEIRNSPCATIKRSRKDVSETFEELGPTCARRAYRMKPSKFWLLHRKLRHYFRKDVYTLVTKKRKKGARNGLIPSTTRLAAALRHFAGGSAYDICLTHGISYKEVFTSVWLVVDAVNESKDQSLTISFPTDHGEQRKLAKGFEKISKVGFKDVVAAIDGILIWIDRPTPCDLELAGFGAVKFLCGRKKKFGVVMTGCVDSERRFLDVDIRHPGATSDYLAFATSSLKKKLDNGLLAPGLVIFGDNAHLNTFHMATPHKVPRGTEDDYNFYHSQCRITVECAFGMLVHKWGTLRKPISKFIGVRKTTAMVMCLCRLHNFCLDDKQHVSELVMDRANIVLNPHFENEAVQVGNDDQIMSPTAILGGGEHFDDVSRSTRRAVEREMERRSGELPREKMHTEVVNKGMKRVKPASWNKSS